MNIESDEVIVIITGAKATPLKLKANYWFKDKELLKRANLPIDLEVERKRVEEPTQPTTEITMPTNQNKADLEPSNKGNIQKMKVVKVTMRIIPLHHKKRVKIQTQQKARKTMKVPLP